MSGEQRRIYDKKIIELQEEVRIVQEIISYETEYEFKESQRITIRGKIIDENGYDAITSKMNEMRQKITTDSATLKMQHYSGSWISDWEYTVRRINEIKFPQSLRTDVQEYECSFLVISY